MSSKFVAYNSSKAALNMQSAVLANRCASSHIKTGMQFACHLSSLPRGLNLPIEHLASLLPPTPCRQGRPPAVLNACMILMGLP